MISVGKLYVEQFILYLIFQIFCLNFEFSLKSQVPCKHYWLLNVLLTCKVRLIINNVCYVETNSNSSSLLPFKFLSKNVYFEISINIFVIFSFKIIKYKKGILINEGNHLLLSPSFLQVTYVGLRINSNYILYGVNSLRIRDHILKHENNLT